MRSRVHSKVAKLRFCVCSRYNFSCCTALGKNLSVAPSPVTLVKECSSAGFHNLLYIPLTRFDNSNLFQGNVNYRIIILLQLTR